MAYDIFTRVDHLEKWFKGIRKRVKDLEEAPASDTTPDLAEADATGVSSNPNGVDSSTTVLITDGTSVYKETLGNIFDELDTGGGGGGGLTVPYNGKVNTFANLPTASDHNNEVYLVLSSQGTKWLPGSLGGTFYPKGYYYSDGSSWTFTGDTPYQATTAEVDTGTETTKFVNPALLTYFRTDILHTVATSGSYSDLEDVPTEFTPESHTHTEAEITDLDKYTQAETDALLDDKVDKVTGKQLSTEDYTTAEKTKLSGIATGATANSSDATLLSRANHTGTQAISTVNGLQTALDGKVDENSAITGATKTKITYDAKGLVTAGADLAASDLPTGIDAAKLADGSISNAEFQHLNGVSSNIQTQLDGKAASSHTHSIANVTGLQTALDGKLDTDATTADIADSTDKRYVTDDDLTNLSNLSGTNTGDQDLSGYFSKSADDTDDITEGTTNKFTTTAEKDKLAFITVTQAVDLDTMESNIATNNAKVTNATHTGDVTGSGALTIASVAITGKTAVTPDAADYILISDSSDSGNLKKALISDLPGGGSGISNVVEDTSPQLGGNLDLNSFTVGDATAADLTKLHALTATSTELNYVDGVTSAIQDQLDAKVSNATHTGEVTGSTTLTVDKTAITGKTEVTPDATDYILISDSSDSGNLKKALISELPGGGSGISEVVEDTTPQLGGNLDLNDFTVGDASAADLTKLSEVTATSTELNYVDGVTSAIQTQLDGKINSNVSGITGADAITNIVSLTQSEYDGITPNATTLYIITDA